MQNAMENNPKFRILQGVIIFVLFRLAGFAKNASPHFPKTPTDDNPMPAPKKSHASKRSVLGAFGSASACDPELNAISNSDPGNPAIPATRSIPGGLGYPTHSANRGEDPLSALPNGFSRGIRSVDKSTRTVRRSREASIGIARKSSEPKRSEDFRAMEPLRKRLRGKIGFNPKTETD
jgi:hypothetical protein